MTCLLYKCIRTADSRLSIRPLSRWRYFHSPLFAANFSTTRTQNAKDKPRLPTTETPSIQQLWHEIHEAEAHLGLPQTKTDGRWREVRLRKLAKDLVDRKTKAKLQEAGTSAGEKKRVINAMSSLEFELYHTEKEELGDSTKAHTVFPKNVKTPPEDKKAREDAEIARLARIKKDLESGEEFKKPSQPRRSKANMEPWQVQKEGLEAKFKEARWAPRKRLSPDALDGIRMLHKSDPDVYTTPYLASHFKISPDAIRRILKSKWEPNEEEIEARKERWERRGKNIWATQAEHGMKPPKKWRLMGVGRGYYEIYQSRKRRGRKEDAIPWDKSTLQRRPISDQIL